MQINIHPTVLFRTPKFPYLSDLSDNWDELKEAISISSSAFFETIQHVEAADLNKLPPKIAFTIWKYFNRAKYRSTPYGTFASFSILENAINANQKEIKIDQKEQIHRFIDWPERTKISFDLNTLLANDCYLFSNSSYYDTIDSIRFIACSDGLFELAEIGYDEFVKQILDCCLSPIRLSALIEKLSLNDEGKSNLYELLQDMHSIQLIFTDFDANIIGEDYFTRISESRAVEYPAYIIAERKVLGGAIDNQLVKPLPALINLLAKVVVLSERGALKNFKTKFQQRFDQQEVSLLTALDPEMGVGYDDLEQGGEGDDFIGQFNHNKETVENKKDLKSILKNYISKEDFNKGEPILLNKLGFDLMDQTCQIPNSLSVLLSIADDLICVDQIGGISANALTGRFSLASADVESYCRQISTIEQEANLNVLFFDVAYLNETNVDNINRRKLVYSHQLSILNYDTSDDPMSLNDILVSVRNNEVVLRSRKKNKRLIPRMASAYNYSRSDLSVFRLLCDLQHQGVQTNLSLSLDTLFPGMDYYPRLQYQNIVLNTQKWRVKKETFYPKNVQLSLGDAKAYLKELGVTQYFKTGLSDQTLCFNLDNPTDLNAFLLFIQKQEQVYLEEVILPKSSTVTDINNAPYLAQFILSITHGKELYGKFELNEAPKVDVQQVYLPGSEWLYFEIYCHQQRSDEILAHVLAAFIKDFDSEIKSWFFIRYNTNGDHLRFRILLNDKKDGHKLTAACTAYLSRYVDYGLVSDIQIKSYKRELDRYGSDLIVAVEQHFHIDSNYVLLLLQQQLQPFSKYQLCNAIVDELQTHGVFESNTLLKIVRMISDSFNEEHHLGAADFKKLNQQYQLYKKSLPKELDSEQKVAFGQTTTSFVRLLLRCEKDRRVRLFSDLMHMHVNRLFNKKQRTNEMVMYYFLLKDLQRKNATAQQPC